jgi:hypothetical protein
MTYTLAQAAAAAGRNRSSVLRAIKSGKISAVRDEATAEWRIEPAELHRLYPVADAQGDSQRNAQSRNGDAQGEIREMRALIAAHENTIDDLRRRLDAEAEERRRLTAALTDQRVNGAAHPTPAGSPWRRFLAWRR